MLGANWTDEKVRAKKLQDLRKGYYNDQVITLLQTGYKPDLDLDGPYPPQRPITRTVKQIANILFSIYTDKIKANTPVIDVQKEAMKYVEQEGIIFIDEIDKLASNQNASMSSRGVSTQGVQRDLLPLIEGSVVNTKLGDIKTDHILFIASGSFSMSKVEDLIPQLLGRLPIRVQLNPVSLEQMQRILRQPQFNLLMQQINLLKMQEIQLIFNDDAIKQMARFAYELNVNTQNIGARRLQMIVQKVVQVVSFDAPNYKGQKFIITKEYVEQKLKPLEAKTQLSKFLI